MNNKDNTKCKKDCSFQKYWGDNRILVGFEDKKGNLIDPFQKYEKEFNGEVKLLCKTKNGKPPYICTKIDNDIKNTNYND